MPTKRKPRSGSLQYWPRKRARRIYPVMSTYPSIDESTLEKPKILAFAGFKAGMAHVIMKDTVQGSASFGEDISVPVTVIDCPPLLAVGVRAYKKTNTGLAIITEAWADKLPKGFTIKKPERMKKGEKKKENKPVKRNSASTQFAKMKKQIEKISEMRLIVSTQPKLAGFGKKTPDVFEIGIVGKTEDKLEFAKDILGKEIMPSQVIKEGELVDTIGITTGKGTTGPVKRFGVVIQNRHAKGKRRHVGSLGQEDPGRVRWSVPMSGQLGFQQRTEHNKRVLKIEEGEDAGKNITPSNGFMNYGVIKGSYVLVKGSVPGPRKRLIFLRAAIRPAKKKATVPEIKQVVR